MQCETGAIDPPRMSSTWKKAIHTKAHKERAQPGYRAHMGLLEKHKDYTLRAKDFAKKKDKMKTLKRKADERNPDEFNFRMNSSKTKVPLCGTGVVRPNDMCAPRCWVLWRRTACTS